MVKKARSKAKIGGITLDSTSFDRLLREIIERIEGNRPEANRPLEGKKAFIVSPNPEFIVYAQKHSWFRKILNQADFAVPDGIGLVWASRFLAFRPLKKVVSPPEAKTPRMVTRRGSSLPADASRQAMQTGEVEVRGGIIRERISGVDLMEKLCQEAAKRGWRVYLFGGKPGVAKKTLTVLKKRYPELKGWAESGPKLNLSPITYHLSPKQEITKIVRRINSKKPDFLFTAFGMGKQEKFIWDNWDKLDVKLAMGVGGAFDYLSSRVPRAPKWVQKSGFEWLYRLIQEPWRWKRQLALLEFIWLVLKEKFQELTERFLRGRLLGLISHTK